MKRQTKVIVRSNDYQIALAEVKALLKVSGVALLLITLFLIASLHN